MTAMMKQFLDNSYLFGGNAPFIEELYETYLDNPGAVPEEWRALLRQAAAGAGRREGRRARADRRILRAARRRHGAAPRRAGRERSSASRSRCCS